MRKKTNATPTRRMLQDLNHLGKRVASELNTFAEKTTSRKRERGR